MIQISAKNSLIQNALMTALNEFHPTRGENSPDSDDIWLICTTQEETNALLKNPPTCAVVLLGTTHPEADLELALPCQLDALKGHLKNLAEKQLNAPDFENKDFLFEGKKRLLTCKKTKNELRLTEKETKMIVFLIKSLPESVSKSDLLTEVWNYRPDSETHTIETHIYALRQKIGEEFCDLFITNTADGYKLVES